MAKTPAKPRKKSTDLSAETRFCVLYGDEDMTKRQHLATLRQALEERFGEVETIVMDAQTSSLADILDELRSYGLMQQHKLVVADIVDAFVSQHRQALERYAANPVDHGTLVLRSKTWRAGGLDKLIGKVGCIIKCPSLGPTAAAKWLIERTAAEYQRKLDPPIASLIVEQVGTDLTRLDNEMAKLTLMLAPGAPITRDAVASLMGRGNDEEAYAAQEAVLGALAHGSGPQRAGEMVARLHELVDLGGQPEVLVAYFVADTVRRLHCGVAMRNQGIGEHEIATQLKMWGPREGMFLNLLRRLDLQRTGLLLDKVVEAERRSKSGRGKPMHNLECFCTVLADVTR